MTGEFVVHFRNGSHLTVGTRLREIDKLRGKKYPRPRCGACIRVGCDDGYDFYVAEDDAGKPSRFCMCCHQRWPSGANPWEKEPEDDKPN